MRTVRAQMQRMLIFVSLTSLEMTACGSQCFLGFSALAVFTFGASEFFVVGAVLCIVGCLAAFLASNPR